MADTERIIVVDPAALARQQLVEDMKRLKENPLDVTVPGGYFLDPGGKTARNANGDPVPVRSEAGLKKEIKEGATAAPPAEAPAKATTKGK